MHVACISSWPPWGHLLAAGVKKVDTWSHELDRSIGLPLVVGVYVGRPPEWTIRRSLEEPYASLLKGVKLHPDSLATEALVGFVRIAACVGTLSMQVTGWGLDLLTPLEYSLGNFSPGRYAWVMDRAVLLPKPIFVKVGARKAHNVFHLSVPEWAEHMVERARRPFFDAPFVR